MKLFLTTLCLFLGITLWAQDCKPFYVGKDEFTGDSLILYGGELDISGFMSDRNIEVYFLAGNGNDSLVSSFLVRRYLDKNAPEVEQTKDELRIEKGAKAYLSLSNGESIVVEAKNKSLLQKKKVLSTITLTTSTYYSFTAAQQALLAANTITGYRIDLAETILQNKKLKPNRTAKLKSQFECAAKRFH